MKAKRLTVLTPKGERGDGLAGSLGEAVGLPGVKEISGDKRDRDAGQNAADDEGVGQAGQFGAEADDNDELAEVIDEKPKEAVDVVRDEPALQE